jgi:hypothetical protein
MLNLKQKRLFICALTAALLLSVAATSTANARDPDPAAPPAPVDGSQAAADAPMLIMTQDGTVTVPDSPVDQPNLYQTQDAPASVDDNSTRVIAQDDTAGNAENNLIAPQAQNAPDFTVPILGAVGILAVAAAVVAAVLIRRRSAD